MPVASQRATAMQPHSPITCQKPILEAGRRTTTNTTGVPLASPCRQQGWSTLDCLTSRVLIEVNRRAQVTTANNGMLIGTPHHGKKREANRRNRQEPDRPIRTLPSRQGDQVLLPHK